MRTDFFINNLSQVEKNGFENKLNFVEIGNRNIQSYETLDFIAQSRTSDYFFIALTDERISIRNSSVNRFLDIASALQSGFLYSDYFESIEGKDKIHPLIDYQEGSVRDDFDFGKLVLIRGYLLDEFLSKENIKTEFSSFYGFRLFVSRGSKIVRIPEPLYHAENKGDDASGEKLFDYLKSDVKSVQSEREKVFTEYLKSIGSFLSPDRKVAAFNEAQFKNKASIIIPVKNRVKTIADAVNSALSQVTDFPFNVIVVDNHSSDGTSEVLNELKNKEENLFVIKPPEKNRGIGGCWNFAIEQNFCGMFAVQLDSDDIYSDKFTLRKIIDKFYETSAAAVVGSYKLTDFSLREIPPGVISHDEWTDINGMNNALRINGFGAPRAFYTPIIRNIKFPDVSYGEDYAVMLAISRSYKVARILDPIYVCRRWEGNSDSNLSVEKENIHNSYKDFLRSVEINIRRKLNRKGE